MVEEFDREGGQIPPDVRKALGEEATQALEARLGAGSDWAGGHFEGEKWWFSGLPVFIKLLLMDKRLDREYYEALLKDAKQGEEKARAEADFHMEANDELHGRLREAKGREDALHDVIRRRHARCMWR